MRLFFFILFASLSLIQGSTMAQQAEDSVNGNLIREPELRDAKAPRRTPGFSKITGIIDQNGQPPAE